MVAYIYAGSTPLPIAASNKLTQLLFLVFDVVSSLCLHLLNDAWRCSFAAKVQSKAKGSASFTSRICAMDCDSNKLSALRCASLCPATRRGDVAMAMPIKYSLALASATAVHSLMGATVDGDTTTSNGELRTC